MKQAFDSYLKDEGVVIVTADFNEDGDFCACENFITKPRAAQIWKQLGKAIGVDIDGLLREIQEADICEKIEKGKFVLPENVRRKIVEIFYLDSESV